MKSLKVAIAVASLALCSSVFAADDNATMPKCTSDYVALHMKGDDGKTHVTGFVSKSDIEKIKQAKGLKAFTLYSYSDKDGTKEFHLF